jgi:hypothetical protein
MATKKKNFGTWTYRSLYNNPNLSATFNSLEFGSGNLKIDIDENGKLTGKIYGTGWKLELSGSYQAGAPATLWFQGKGMVSGALWVYDYLCYVVPQIPNGKNQVAALVGSVTRAIPHPGAKGVIQPAGVVCSFYAVHQTAK